VAFQDFDFVNGLDDKRHGGTSAGRVERRSKKGTSTMGASLLRKMLVAASVFMGPLGCSALAADLPLKAPVKALAVTTDNWSGPYVGLIAGGAEGRTSAGSTVDCPIAGFLCDPSHYPEYGALIGATASGSKSRAVFTAGGLAGYNWHLDRFVYGIEADLSSLHLGLTDRGSGASLNPGLVNNPGAVPVVFTASATAGINWLATFRARVGYLVSADFLVYATGGLALTSLSVSNSYSDNWMYNGGGLGNSSVTSNATGYVVGGGAEWGLARSWTLKAEYLRADFGSLTTSGAIIPVQVPAARNTFTSSANLAANLFRAGLNYKF
jgi:outer membrane immunogenic protein